jgi:hypothetical protein
MRRFGYLHARIGGQRTGRAGARERLMKPAAPGPASPRELPMISWVMACRECDDELDDAHLPTPPPSLSQEEGGRSEEQSWRVAACLGCSLRPAPRLVLAAACDFVGDRDIGRQVQGV